MVSYSVVVVVVDSHIQRIVLATEETTVTRHVSHRPIKYQSRLWSQRGTEFIGSHMHPNNVKLLPAATVPAVAKLRHRRRGKRGIRSEERRYARRAHASKQKCRRWRS